MENVSALKLDESNPKNAIAQFNRRPIYGKFSLVLIGVMLLTLLPHYGKFANPGVQVPLAVIIHGALY